MCLIWHIALRIVMQIDLINRIMSLDKIKQYILYKKKVYKFKIYKPFVGVAGFEPATSSSQTRRDDRATLHPDFNYLSK